LEENICGKWKFEAILGKFIFGCEALTEQTRRPVVRKIKTNLKKVSIPTYPT
jgi:hypothetical protein